MNPIGGSVTPLRSQPFLVVAIALLAVEAGTSLAQAPPGINLAWDDCLGAAGSQDRTVARVNTPVVVNRLFCSFVVPWELPRLAASDAIMDIHVASSTIPAVDSE